MLDARESILEQARRWLAAGERVAWATVVSTWSSSPRPLGSLMVIAPELRFFGSVSGGCVESAVIEAADDVLAGGPARTLSFGVSSEQAWEVGLPCGGTIEVLLASAARPVIERCCEAAARRESIAVLSDLESGLQQTWEPGSLASDTQLEQAVAAAVHREQSARIELGGRRLFVNVLAAPLRLVVVGAVHLTQALAALAQLSGVEVIVVDPRAAFASEERFPGIRLVQAWPDEGLHAIGLDRRTAVVVLSHDAKLDDPALKVALGSDCFYIGALGSRRSQQGRRERLGAAGFDAASLARIHGPVGLDLGALTPQEIAISIMAQLIQVWRQRPAPAG